MAELKLKISDSNLDQLVNYLIRKLDFDYENHSADMSILMSRNFGFLFLRNVSTKLKMVILKKEKSFILIDIIAEGDETIIFPESGYTKKVAKLIYRYAEERTLTVEPN